MKISHSVVNGEEQQIIKLASKCLGSTVEAHLLEQESRVCCLDVFDSATTAFSTTLNPNVFLMVMYLPTSKLALQRQSSPQTLRTLQENPCSEGLTVTMAMSLNMAKLILPRVYTR